MNDILEDSVYLQFRYTCPCPLNDNRIVIGRDPYLGTLDLIVGPIFSDANLSRTP